MKNTNYIYLGIGISYALLAALVLFRENSLSLIVYFTVASVSLNLTFFEFCKTVIRIQLSIYDIKFKITADYISMFKEEYRLYENHGKLNTEMNFAKGRYNEEYEKYNKLTSTKVAPVLRKLDCVLSILQVTIGCALSIVIPAFYNAEQIMMEKLINVFSLLSFSIMFFTYYLNYTVNTHIAYEKNRIDGEMKIKESNIEIVRKLID